MPIKCEYKPEVCECCGQRKTYVLPLDRGTAAIVYAFSVAVRLKGVNMIHPRKEMEIDRGNAFRLELMTMIRSGIMTSNMVGNLTRARIHGLLARVEKEAGNWCLTTKGAAFLRGEHVARYAVVRKTTADNRSHKDEYWKPETEQITIAELAREGEYWQPIDFTIHEGRVVAA